MLGQNYRSIHFELQATYRNYEVLEGLSIIFLDAFLGMLLVLFLKGVLTKVQLRKVLNKDCCASDQSTMST